ncbi:MAG: hypothetical protein U1D67_01885 [Dehalococcoidia bacterium]|nr:hypothetical protein [Dehalococcoidia bacterium]
MVAWVQVRELGNQVPVETKLEVPGSVMGTLQLEVEVQAVPEVEVPADRTPTALMGLMVFPVAEELVETH